MKTVDVRDFQEHSSRYLHGDSAVAVAPDGWAIGLYIPVPQAHDARFLATIGRLEASVARVLAETGMSEDELASLFDLARPTLLEYDAQTVLA